MTPTPDPRSPGLYLVIDGPPSRVGGRFMEVEDERGASVRVEGATWREEVEQWSLGPFAAPYPDPLRAPRMAMYALISARVISGEPGDWMLLEDDMNKAFDSLAAKLKEAKSRPSSTRS